MPVRRYEGIEAAPRRALRMSHSKSKSRYSKNAPLRLFLTRQTVVGAEDARKSERRLKWECIGCHLRVCGMISSLVVIFLT